MLFDNGQHYNKAGWRAQSGSMGWQDRLFCCLWELAFLSYPAVLGVDRPYLHSEHDAVPVSDMDTEVFWQGVEYRKLILVWG